MSFENINQRPLSLIVKNAERIIKKYPDRIYEDSFVNIYEDSEIKADIEYALRMEKEFDKDQSQESKDAKKIADAIEIVVNHHIELSNWLYKTFTYKTSKYDDIKNGIDTILEFINEDNKNDSTFLGVAFDITYKNDVRDKFLRIKKEIEDKKINKVKYFESQESNYKGQIENVPRLIIGLDIKTGEELIELFLERRGGKEKLGNHFFQFELIDELLFQLEIFITYSDEVGNNKAYNSYNKIKEKLLETKKEKDKLNTLDKDYRTDYFYNFCDTCDNIFNR